MARYRDSLCKLCRRELTKLYLKGERCTTNKCAIDRRNYLPGMHGQKRQKIKEYGIQLREKQKARRIYGIMEKQFKNTFKRAERKKGITGEIFLQLLELRLDNVVARLGFGANRRQARQLISHKHFLVNGKMMNLPSYQVKKGDTIEISTKSKKRKNFIETLKKQAALEIPSWLSVTENELKGQVIDEPKLEDIKIPVKEQLIVEFYSK